MCYRPFAIFAGCAFVIATLFATSAEATVVDLTTSGAQGFLNDALFVQVGPQPTGTGFINSFVRLNDNDGSIAGYNTNVNNVFDNMADDPHNRELLLTDVPTVTILGIVYRQFLLDVNENSKDASLSQISLDEVQVFQSSAPNQSTETFIGDILQLGDLVYRMDPGNSVLLDYALNSGSGSGDMFMYIPDSFFSFGGQYVYLYSSFGLDIATEDAGFEEWAVLSVDSPIPEPASVLLLGIGLAGIAARRRKKA